MGDEEKGGLQEAEAELANQDESFSSDFAKLAEGEALEPTTKEGDKTKEHNEEVEKLAAGEEKPPDKGSQTEDWEHKYKTLQGMYNKAEKDLKTLEEKVTTQAENQTDKGKEKPLEDVANLFDDLIDLIPEEDREEFKRYQEEMDNVNKFEGIKQKALAKKLITRFEASLQLLANNIAPYLDLIKENTASSHFSTIKAQHSDFEELRDSGQIKEWITTQPKYMQDAYTKAYQNGSAEEVIDLLTRFKTEKGIATKDKSSTTDERVQSLSVVKNKQRGIQPATSKGIANKDDYSGAWNEAVSKK
jgi:hypothetical protein